MSRILENSIAHEIGDFFVLTLSAHYEVRRNVSSVSLHDSSYAKTPDGLSIAIARANYMAKRAGK